MSLNNILKKIEITRQKLPVIKRKAQIAGIGKAQYLVKQRVFKDGRATDGSKIGSYSTKKLYYNPNTHARKYGSLVPKIKRRRKYFKNGRQRKTVTFENGYKELRSHVNRNNASITLTWTFTTFHSIQGVIYNNNYVLAFINEEGKNRMGWAEKRANKNILKLSDVEVDISSAESRIIVEGELRNIWI